jgi:CRP/FNR family transcriptional regulator, cyclic AMP receptor protein
MDPDNLRAVPLFAEMADHDLKVIATFATEDSVPAGATLMREGDYSNDMVAIESGTADVVQGDRTVASLGPGDIVGEMGVLTRDLRNASVVATSPMRLVRLTTWDVKRLPKETRERIAELVRSRQSAGSADGA